MELAGAAGACARRSMPEGNIRLKRTAAPPADASLAEENRNREN
jgi:hypothetical protein